MLKRPPATWWPGKGGPTKLRYWPGCAAGPKETVVSPASATAAMVLMLPGVYAVPTHFYLTLDQTPKQSA